MSLLNNKFDVVRGWPQLGAIDDTFPVHVTGGTPDDLAPGSVVTQQSDGSMAVATTPNMTTTDAVATWIVVESNEDFSAKFLSKVVCIRGNAELRLDPANFAAGSYSPGTKVSFSAGQFKVAAVNDQIIGEVLSNDSAVDGTLRIFYTGGAVAKK